jgi:spore coat polysaccharide biosynthesis protein SpsF
MKAGRVAPNVVAIVQARMESKRLPGKTLVDICGKPLLVHIIERIKRCSTIQTIAVATTSAPVDKVLIRLADKMGVSSYAGASEDVLDRFYYAAKLFKADVVVRITADDPFKDPRIVDLVTRRLLYSSGELDYVSNTIAPTYPEGLDVEVFTFAALERAWHDACLDSEREHVTPYIWKHPELFRLYNVVHRPNLSHLRWTLDYEQDLAFARAVYERLYKPNRVFLMRDILNLLDREPQLARINAGIVRNAGYLKSIEQDKEASYP